MVKLKINPEEVRDKLINYMQQHPTSVRALSEKIKIDQRTISKFLEGENVSIKTLCGILGFLATHATKF